jgi:hypothetical protein
VVSVLVFGDGKAPQDQLLPAASIMHVWKSIARESNLPHFKNGEDARKSSCLIS